MVTCTFTLLLIVAIACGKVLGDSRTNRSAGVVAELNEQSHFDVNTKVAPNNASGLVKAAEYLMRQRNAGNWGDFTPRAVVAMSFASRASPVGVEEKELMKKQLNVQLLLGLMQNQRNKSASKLALYINALYATCQDPRNFQGLDLVAKLRSYTDEDSGIPLAYLTLCLAGEFNHEDAHTMTALYNETERMSSRALLVMAMICYIKTVKVVTLRDRINYDLHDGETVRQAFEENLKQFLLDGRAATDVYTKALFMQASLAAGRSIVVENLLSEQLADGSFGDMLSTYCAIPVLMNSTLLDLKCSSTKNTGMSMGNLLLKGNDGDEHHVAYSLWVSADADDEVKSHQLTVTYNGNKSFFEVMLMAAARDPPFWFLYDETDNEKQVYSIGGIPNDSESRKSWKLYSGTINRVTVNSVRNLKLEKESVDRIFPKNQSHFVFWLKRDHV